MVSFLNRIPKIVIFNVLLAILILLALLLPEGFFSHLYWSKKKTHPISDGSQKDAVSIQHSFQRVYHLVKDSVVSIRTKKTELITSPYAFYDYRNERFSSLGSGFLIDSKGYIVTNYHVVREAQEIEVIASNGRVFTASFAGSHEGADIALLKIRESSGLRPVTLGNSDEIQVGDWSIAVGSPFGLERSFSVGVISARSREDLDETGQTHIQTDTMINPGSSGGPLLNIYGEVIGINQMIRTGDGRNSGIGFAIPINYAKEIIGLIRENPGVRIRPATLGVMATVPLPDHRKALEIPEEWNGVLIYDIERDSSAEAGGLKRYDFILEANGRPIRNINDLREQIGIVGLGGQLLLKIYRDSRIVTLLVKLIAGGK